jgi:hypothetical protein
MPFETPIPPPIRGSCEKRANPKRLEGLIRGELDESGTDDGKEGHEGLNQAASEDGPNRVLREPRRRRIRRTCSWRLKRVGRCGETRATFMVR